MAATQRVDAALERRSEQVALLKCCRLRVSLCVTRKLPWGKVKMSFRLLTARSMPLALNVP
jgi:hypothetical protein